MTTERIQPTWTRPNDGAPYTEADLLARAREIAETAKSANQKIVYVGNTAQNTQIPDLVNGRMVNPVAENVIICSAIVDLEEVEPESAPESE